MVPGISGGGADSPVGQYFYWPGLRLRRLSPVEMPEWQLAGGTCSKLYPGLSFPLESCFPGKVLIKKKNLHKALMRGADLFLQDKSGPFVV